MKNNKLISILLALLVCLSMVVSVSAAETDVIFALESADSSVEELNAAVVGAGEEFVVTVDIAQNAGFKNAILYVEFNDEQLELVAVKSLDEANVNVFENGKIYIGSGKSWEAGAAYTKTGSVAELTFKVKVETDEQITIALNVSQKNVTNAAGKANVLTVAGDGLTVNAVSAAHECDETKVVEKADSAVEATCTEAGKAVDMLCAHCGKLVVEGEEIPAAGHAWGEWVVTTPSTCASFGVQTRTCATCGETETDSSKPMTEHTFGAWTVKTPATTEAEGVEARTCSGCGKEETRSIEKLPAAPVEPVEKNNNTLVIVIIVVVVLAGAGAAAYFILKNKKK